MSVKTDKIGSSLVREISEILANEIKDEHIKFVTITAATVTTDLSYGKVYFTVLDDDKLDVTEKALNRAAGFIRKELKSRIDIRKMPELKFIYDESINYGNKIEHLIDKLK
jgi:ribosome-binding factor A